MDSNMTNTSTKLYCGTGVQEFHAAYLSAHGFVSLAVCVFGCVANTLNIAVLTRREMLSPTNAILTGLAVADLAVMLEYIPFSCHMYLGHQNRSREEMYSYGYAWFVLFHSIFTQACHTISIWLTVTLAVWRYIAIAHPQKNREWCRMETTIAAITGAYIACPVICIPLYLAFSIMSKTETLTMAGFPITNTTSLEDRKNATIYLVDKSDLGRANDDALVNVNFWIYSVVIKIIPCVALTVLSLRLIMALLETKKRRKKLISASRPESKSDSETKSCLQRPSKQSDMKERQTDRTTRMLLAVLLLFLITEFPQGILGLLSAVLGNPFFSQCYLKLGEVMDILALSNSAINFILYCAMSRQFRTTFRQLFLRSRFLDRCSQAVHLQRLVDNNGHTTHVTQVTQV